MAPKSKVMVFNNRNIISDIFKFSDQQIEIVKEYKYVGTIFSSNTQSVFKQNSSHLIEKAHRAIFSLTLHIKDSVGYLPPDLAIKMLTNKLGTYWIMLVRSIT